MEKVYRNILSVPFVLIQILEIIHNRLFYSDLQDF